jgi:hypothetical protein
MKYLFTVLFLLPLLASAQDCKLKKGTDDMTSRPTLSTGFLQFGTFTLSMDAGSKEIDFFFIVNTGSRCFDVENTNIVAVFEGGKQKTEYKNSGGLNCDGIIHVTFKNLAFTPSNLQKLATKKVISFIFTDSNSKAITIPLNPAQQQMLMDNATCIAAQAKTII